MKPCMKCGLVLELDQFYKHPQMGDGHLNKCKDCTRADVAANYARRREQYAKYERRRFQHPDRKAKVAVYRQNLRRANPLKAKAWNAVSNAIRDGRLTRPPACSVCGKVGKVQAHHHDYSKPLDVIWECFKCHREREHGQVVLEGLLK